MTESVPVCITIPLQVLGDLVEANQALTQEMDRVKNPDLIDQHSVEVLNRSTAAVTAASAAVRLATMEISLSKDL